MSIIYYIFSMAVFPQNDLNLLYRSLGPAGSASGTKHGRRDRGPSDERCGEGEPLNIFSDGFAVGFIFFFGFIIVL